MEDTAFKQKKNVEKNFKVCCVPKKYPYQVIKKKIKIGFDPKLHTKIP